MSNILQALRTPVTGRAPAAASRQPGELWVNFPDMQMGVIDASQNPQKLVAVRYFSTAAAYAAGEFVVQAGGLWVAKASVPAGAFVPSQWNQLATYTGGTFQSLIINGAPGTARSIVGQSNSVNRWELQLGGVETEGGSNAGSNFNLIAYNDAGASLGVVLTSYRKHGGLVINAIGATAYDGSSNSAGVANLVLNKQTGANSNNIWGTKDGLTRWGIQLGNGTAEGGSNAGSDFGITRYADNGAALPATLNINRATNVATFGGAINGPSAGFSGAVSAATMSANNYGAVTASSLNCTGGCSMSGGQITIPPGPAGGPNPVIWMTDGNTNRLVLYFDVSTGTTTLSDVYSGSSIQMGTNGAISLNPTHGAAVNAGSAFFSAGAATFNSTILVQGAATIRGALDLTGGATMRASVNVLGSLQCSKGAQTNPNLYMFDGSSNRSVFYFDTPTGHTTMYDIYSGGSIWLDPGATFCFVGTTNAQKAGGGPWIATSDARIKDVHGEYTRGLDAILKLRPVTYTYKGNDTPSEVLSAVQVEGEPEVMQVVAGEAPYPASAHHLVAKTKAQLVGLVAQEVETVFPDMVSKREGYIDGKKVNDLRSIDTNNLIYALVNAVKELSARIQVLEGTATGKPA